MVYEDFNNEGINIGDYIQSLAARQFLNSPYVYLNREHLNEYSGDKVKLMMNGWFIHNPGNWPPSDCIEPLLVAFHISTFTKGKLLSGKSVEWLKNHEPVGCRDGFTERALKEKGIDSYFSGCLTLTLGKSYKRAQSDGHKTYFVEPVFYAGKGKLIYNLKVLFFGLKNFRKIKIILQKKYNKNSIKNFYLSSAFFMQYRKLFPEKILLNSEYVSHQYEAGKNDDYYFSEADTLLKKYADAKLVVTSRIHCALPCTGMETPVVYVQNEKEDDISKCRMEKLIDLLNVINLNKDKLENKNEIDCLNPPVKKDYIPYKESLVKRCSEFAE